MTIIIIVRICFWIPSLSWESSSEVPKAFKKQNEFENKKNYEVKVNVSDRLNY